MERVTDKMKQGAAGDETRVYSFYVDFAKLVNNSMQQLIDELNKNE